MVPTPPDTGYGPAISPPSGMTGAGAKAFVLKNSLTRLLTVPLRPASLSVAPGANTAVVYMVAGPNRVPAEISRMLNGCPAWRVTIPQTPLHLPSFLTSSRGECSRASPPHSPLLAHPCGRPNTEPHR